MPKASFIKHSLRHSNFSSITSTTLVLFVLGVLGILLYDAVKIAHYVQENVGFTVVLNERIQGAQQDSLEATLKSQPYVKSLKVITKEMAEKEMRHALGEDFVHFLGYNPLPVTLEVQLHHAFADPVTLKEIEQSLTGMPTVKEIVYPTALVNTVHKHLSQLAGALGLLFTLMLLVSVFLINGAIRLEMYSGRYTLMVMRRVGATQAFIRRPYIKKAWKQGLIAGGAASVALFMAYLGLYAQLGENLTFFINIREFAVLCLSMMAAGVVLVTLCTWFSVSSVIHAKLEKNELFSDLK